MGSLKDEMYDNEEQDWHEDIAEKLGITVDELDLLDWSTDENCSEDGLVYGVIINVEKSSSDNAVYEKIAHRLNNGNWANLDDL